MFAQESGEASYLDETLKRALVCIKRQFDKFIVSSLAAGHVRLDYSSFAAGHVRLD